MLTALWVKCPLEYMLWSRWHTFVVETVKQIYYSSLHSFTLSFYQNCFWCKKFIAFFVDLKPSPHLRTYFQKHMLFAVSKQQRKIHVSHRLVSILASQGFSRCWLKMNICFNVVLACASFFIYTQNAFYNLLLDTRSILKFGLKKLHI